MKLNLLILLFSILGIHAFAQVSVTPISTENNPASENLVPNESFERFSSTPIGWFYKGSHFTDVMKYWSSATGTSPDVFGKNVRVPSQWAEKGFGDQKARTGNSMVGITVYGCEDGKPHCREYLQIQMKEPLVVGQKYQVDFWVSQLPNTIGVNNLGMAFHDEQLYEKTEMVLDKLTPEVVSANVVKAEGHWVKVTGSFTAKKELDYLIIGNFFKDSDTTADEKTSCTLKYAYYYIDDISVKKADPIINVPVKADDLCCLEVEKGDIIQLKEIFFDTDKAELLPRSYVELNKLLTLMNRYPTMIIRINGHTDKLGGHDYNIGLSNRRSKAVADYLIQHGVATNRVTYKGYGSTNPIADNETVEGRQLNRRVEFEVISN